MFPPPYRATDDKVMAPTFDAGPNPAATEAIVELLEKYDAKATFFVLCKRAEQYDEIARTDQAISASGYTGAIQFRSHYGSRFIVLPLLLWKARRTHVLWSIALDDWASPSPESMLADFDAKLVPGSIVLLHDGYPGDFEARDNTVKVLEAILKKYSGLGYRFVAVGELLSTYRGSDGRGLLHS